MLYRLGELIIYTLPSNGQEQLLTLTKLVRTKLKRDMVVWQKFIQGGLKKEYQVTLKGLA